MVTTIFRRERRREASPPPPKPTDERSVVRALGLGLITGAADDDPSAVGTYAAAGAKMGPSFFWTAPVMFPMMFTVVYLSAKLGLVTGKGLFDAISDRYSRWVLWPTLIGVLLGNVFEASADIGGVAAALGILIPIHFRIIVIAVAASILALQVWGSYVLIRNVFRWLSLALFAYLISAILSKPDLLTLVRGTLIPTLHFDRESLSMLVAIIGTSLSAYLYTWQSNEEVEEKIAQGLRRHADRAGTTAAELRKSRRDILIGMIFSNIIMYFILVATASTLYRAGRTNIATAADAAEALRPLAGNAASVLFAAGVVAVGFLAVPVMTTGAAYDLAQTVGWRHGLSVKPRQAKKFYLTIAVFTAIAAAVNFLGFNPMRVLVWAGIVQGFSTPPLLLLIMLLTNDRRVMGPRVNSLRLNVLGWTTTAATFAAAVCLIITWVR